MNNLTLSTETGFGCTSVSNIFISEYLPMANGEFVKVYLYLLYLLNHKNNNISISLLADTFNQTEADIMRALRYWDKLGVISLYFSDTDNSLYNITIKDLNKRVSANNNSNKLSTGIVNRSAISNIAVSKPSDNIAGKNESSLTNSLSRGSKQLKPSDTECSPDRIHTLVSDSNFSILIYAVESYLSRPLSPKETNAIVFFYDTLHFSTELIDYLFEYCVERGKKSINYIETVALAWADKGIRTISEAKEEVANHTDSIYQIMKAFGLSNREPAKQEKAMIAKWSDTYCFDTDIIIEACNRTIKAIHQPSFEYADTILSNWKNSNVNSMADIAKADAAFAAGNNSKAKAVSSKPANNRFNNFQQRDKKSDDWYNSLLGNNN